MRSAAMAHLLCEARPPRRGGSGSGRSRYQYDTPITWLRKTIRSWDATTLPGRPRDAGHVLFGVVKTDRRIAQARQLFDDDVVAGHRYGAPSKRPNFRQHLERRSESGDLGENLLGSANHLPVLDVVSGLAPGAAQSPVLDRSPRQVCAQMSTPPRDREVFAVDVPNGIRSRTGHRPRGQVGNRAHRDLLCHASLQSPPTVLNTSLSTYPRPHAGKHPQNAADPTATGSLPDSLERNRRGTVPRVADCSVGGSRK